MNVITKFPYKYSNKREVVMSTIMNNDIYNDQVLLLLMITSNTTIIHPQPRVKLK